MLSLNGIIARLGQRSRHVSDTVSTTEIEKLCERELIVAKRKLKQIGKGDFPIDNHGFVKEIINVLAKGTVQAQGDEKEFWLLPEDGDVLHTTLVRRFQYAQKIAEALPSDSDTKQIATALTERIFMKMVDFPSFGKAFRDVALGEGLYVDELIKRSRGY